MHVRLSFVHCQPACFAFRLLQEDLQSSVYLTVACLQTIDELQDVRQQLSHVTDTASASKALIRVERQLKEQAQASALVL